MSGTSALRDLFSADRACAEGPTSARITALASKTRSAAVPVRTDQILGVGGIRRKPVAPGDRAQSACHLRLAPHALDILLKDPDDEGVERPSVPLGLRSEGRVDVSRDI